jgi:hypothetical protein
MAEGGEVKTYAGDQGSVTSEESVNSIIDKLGPEQLQQARENAMNRRDMDTVTAIDKRLAELAQSKSLYAGLGGAFDQIDPEQQEAMMAGGGIVAFANGGSYLDRAEKSREEQLGFIDQATTMPSPEDRRKDIVAQRDMIKGLYEPSVLPKYLEETKAERANLGKNMEEAKGLGALLAAAEMVGARNIREGARASTKAFVGEVSRVAKENKEADRLLRQSEIQLATASELYNNGMTDKAIAEGLQFKYSSYSVEDGENKGWVVDIIVKEAGYSERTIQQLKYNWPSNIDPKNMEYHVVLDTISALTQGALTMWYEVAKMLSTDEGLQKAIIDETKKGNIPSY